MNDNIKSYTHIALVIDASGSMEPLRPATISTLKEFFASLKSPEDKTVVDVWQFDDRVRHLLNGIDLERGTEQAIENYRTGGCTALYDAICTGIDELGAKFASMPEDDRPDGVVFAILTDGFENASKSFSIKDVKSRITHQREKYSWNFRFLAANQDAVLTGGEMGLDAQSCQTMLASPRGIKLGGRALYGHFCEARMEARECRRARKMAK